MVYNLIHEYTYYIYQSYYIPLIIYHIKISTYMSDVSEKKQGVEANTQQNVQVLIFSDRTEKPVQLCSADSG